jgi:hypothetical protein
MPRDVPIRDYIDTRFDDHQRHVDGQFEDLKAEVRTQRAHRHPELASWRKLIVIGISIVGVVAAWVRVF